MCQERECMNASIVWKPMSKILQTNQKAQPGEAGANLTSDDWQLANCGRRFALLI